MNGNQQSEVAAHLARAREAYARGDLAEANSLAVGLTATVPESEDAWRILAAAAQRQGRLADAAQALKDGIAHNPASAPLFTMLGQLLRDSGRLDDAETALSHALTLDALAHDARLELGNVLARLGRLHEAEEVFRAGTELAPQDTRFALQLARILLAFGRMELARPLLEQAARTARSALERKGAALQDPSVYVEIATDLGGLLLNAGERLAALDYLYDAVEMGGGETARKLFGECVTTIPFVEPQPLLKPVLLRALAGAWIQPSALMRQCAEQLMLDPAFSAAAERIELIAPRAEAPLTNPDVVHVASDALLRAMLASAVIPRADFERMLTALRRLMLEARRDPDAPAARGSEALLPFAAALAEQSFLNGYLWAEADSESALVDSLAARIAASGESIALSDLAIYAAYRPLAALDCAGDLLARSWPPAIEPLIRQQLREPAREAKLHETIPAITAIPNAASQAVRASRIKAPVPRWNKASVRTQRVTLEQWLMAGFPGLVPEQMPMRGPGAPLDVLVAGCGTGEEAIGAATRFFNAQVLAVDLDRTALAYAARKTEEIGLANITYAEADLLELDGIARQFDVVECAGVLQEMDEPLEGWKALARATKPGGFLLLALPSRAGRADIAAASAFVAAKGYGDSDTEVRRFRADVLALPSDDPVRRLSAQRDEFYNLPLLRELVFRGPDRGFTLAEVADAIFAAGLEFCGMASDPEIRRAFAAHSGKDAAYAALEEWAAFETENPDSFATMYHMLLRRA